MNRDARLQCSTLYSTGEKGSRSICTSAEPRCAAEADAAVADAEAEPVADAAEAELAEADPAAADAVAD